MSLAEDFDNSLVYANFLIDYIGVATAVGMVGGACVELSSLYRALGICELLVDGDVDEFFHSIIHSALTRKYYLARCIREGTNGLPEQRVSLLGPVFDAIAANELALASDLIELCSTKLTEGFEDDVDFAFAGVIRALLSPNAPDSRALRTSIEAYTSALAGEDDARLATCSALERRDAEAFDAAMTQLIDGHRKQMVALEVSVQSTESSYAANCFIFMEGLAMLRLADHFRIPTAAEYPLCPSLARLSSYRPFSPSSFPNMEL